MPSLVRQQAATFNLRHLLMETLFLTMGMDAGRFPRSLYYCPPKKNNDTKPNSLPLKRSKDHLPFYVITGGPGVGKTALLEELRQRGFMVVPETARELIKAQQAIGGEALPWKNRKQYMELMFEGCKAQFEKTLQDVRTDRPVFFDRGFVDALGYAALEGLPIDREMKSLAETHRYHPQVFILPPWKDIYHTDAQRTQDWNESVFTYNKMIQTYRGYQYDLIEVPRVTVPERADFVLESINSK